MDTNMTDVIAIVREECWKDREAKLGDRIIARLAALAPHEPAKDGPEVVAWRVKDFADGWILCPTEQAARTYTTSGHLGQPLIRLSDYEALRVENERLRDALEKIIDPATMN